MGIFQESRRQEKIFREAFGLGTSTSKKKKRAKLSASERIYIWEHPKLYGRTCNICHQRITKMSELELDHTIAHSKGGKKLALAHAICNRMKGKRSLGYVQKRIGVKKIKRRTTKRKKLKRRTNVFGLPISRSPWGI